MPIPAIHIILDNLRSAHNTGNIFRLADAVGAREILCCGYTPAPPHPKLEKTAMGADKTVPYRIFATAFDAVRTLRAEGCEKIMAVETAPNATDVWDADWPSNSLALIFGNEALGITPDALQEADECLSLPMFGLKQSINVGNCAAVTLYAAVRAAKRRECAP